MSTAPATRDDAAVHDDAPARLYLADVQRLLTLFAQGLSGRYLHLKPLDTMTGDFRPDGATTDGRSIWLPASVATFPIVRHNLGVYRVSVLHQLGYLEQGTFTFSLDAARARIPGLPPEPPRPADAEPDLDRFFALWDAPGLMRRIFVTLEDLRIDRAMPRRYPGVRADLARVLAQALASRPEVDGAPRLLVLYEALVRYTLGAPRDSLGGAFCVPGLEAVLDSAAALEDPHADVHDTAAAAVACYRILRRAARPEPVPPAAGDATTADDAARGGPSAGEADGDAGPLDEDALDAMAVDFRGEIQPGLVQRRMRSEGMVGSLEGLQAPSDPVSPPGQAAEDERVRAQDRRALRRAFGADDPAARSFLYDEWDFHAQDWLKGWCRLFERRLSGRNHAFIREVHERHATLSHQVRRQFRFVRPDSWQRVRRVSDGPEVELDGLIEAVIDRRAGHATDEHLYMRRDRALREVAAAFLLDVSASTDFPIPDPDAPPPPPAPPPDPDEEDDLPYLYGSMRHLDDDATPSAPKRRVIDIAKESLALMSEALESLGDLYAVYGFSGYGRHEVDFLVAKEFDDRLSAATWAAIAEMKPLRSTRMGPAIRHAVAKLARQSVRMKVLIIVSDGFPEDCDYGPDRNDREYGIQDTAMALREAERQGIQTFCMTIDRAGHDYLRRMCPDNRYLVIDEVSALPGELAKVYRALTR